MAPLLYCVIESAPVRSVFLTYRALGINMNLKYLEPGENMSPEFLKLNPQHTVPTMVDDDDFIIWDSHAINAYLVEAYGKDDSLYPSDLKQRAVVDQRLHFDSGTLFPRMVNSIKGILAGDEKKITKENVDSIKEAYSFLEAFLEGQDYVAGNQLTIADFNIVATITTTAVFVPVSPSEYPRISAWLKKMEALPYYKEGNGKGLAQFEKNLKAKLG